MAKINITLSDDLLKKVDIYADEHYMTRSGFFSMCAVEKIQADEIVQSIHLMTKCFKKISDSGFVDEETQKELDKLISISELFDSYK